MTTFEPSFDLIQEDDCNTLLLYLPGFTKEELRVQLTRSRVLKISGTRAIGDNKWSSFQKDFPVAENCDTSRISAKFEEGILYVRQPKIIVPEHKAEDKIIPPPKPAEQPPAPKMDPPPKTAPNNLEGDTPKQQESHVKDFQEKRKVEEKHTTDEKVKKDDEKVTGHKKDDEKVTGRKKDDEKVTGRKKVDEKVKKDDLKNGAGKSDERVSSGRVGRVGGYSVVNAAERLRMEKEKVMKIVLFLFAFALGMYVSNKLPNWSSTN